MFGECCKNPPTFDSSSGGGVVQKLGGLNSYISGPIDAKSAVVLVSDFFGYEAPHLRKIADEVGAAGFYAVAPDFFCGDPYVPDQKSMSDWLKDHAPDEAFEYAKPVIEALKSKGVSKIGAVGFCWGAKVAVDLAMYPYYIQAGVLISPAFVTVEDIQGVKVPLCVLGGENDGVSPPELLKQFEAALKAKLGMDSMVKIYPGVSPGWSLKYNDDDEAAVKSAEESHKDLLNWFIKHLK